MKSPSMIFCLIFLFLSCDTKNKVIESQRIHSQTVLESNPLNNNSEQELQKVIDAYHAFQDSNRLDDGEWEMLSGETLSNKKEVLSGLVNDLNGISTVDLSEKNLINYEMLKILVEDKLFNLNYKTHLMPLNAEGGFIIGMVYQTQNERLTSQDIH